MKRLKTSSSWSVTVALHAARLRQEDCRPGWAAEAVRDCLKTKWNNWLRFTGVSVLTQ